MPGSGHPKPKQGQMVTWILLVGRGGRQLLLGREVTSGLLCTNSSLYLNCLLQFGPATNRMEGLAGVTQRAALPAPSALRPWVLPICSFPQNLNTGASFWGISRSSSSWGSRPQAQWAQLRDPGLFLVKVTCRSG
jgi:hypothetical protein